MANTFLNPTTIARASLGLLVRDVVLPMTVNRQAQQDFQGRVGDTINVRKPASFTSRTYTDTLRTAGTPIVVDDATETSIPIVLNNHIYSAAAVTDEQLSLTITDFGQQVLQPQIAAVAIGAENALAAVMNALAGGLTTGAISTSTAPTLNTTLLAARKQLNQANVPFENRYLAVSPDVEQFILADQTIQMVRYNTTGDSPNTALREAQIGRLYGFQVVVSNALTANTAVAYHQDAFAFVSVAPVVPDGATFGQGASYAGIGMRWLRDYDAAFLRDRSIVSMLAGAKTLDTARAVKITATP